MLNELNTPAFLTEEKTLQGDLTRLRKFADTASCKLLYSPKASAISKVLEVIAKQVDGFACSSPFELRRLGDLSGGRQTLHLVSPLIKSESLSILGDRLNYLTVNNCMAQVDSMRRKECRIFVDRTGAAGTSAFGPDPRVSSAGEALPARRCYQCRRIKI